MKWVLLELALKIATSRRLFSIFTGPLLSLVRRLGGSDRLDHRKLSPELRLKEFPAGLRFAFSDIQARIGIKLLESLNDEDNRRRTNAMRYQQRLQNYSGFSVPLEVEGGRGNFWMYTVTLRCPEKLKAFLWSEYRIDTILPSIDPCHEMPYFDWAPVLYLSALSGQRTHRIFGIVENIAHNHRRRIRTGGFNQLLFTLTQRHQPPVQGTRRPRLFFGSQIQVAPPTFVVFAGYARSLSPTYRRYIERMIREKANFEGSPVRLFIRERKRSPSKRKVNKRGKVKPSKGTKK